MSHVDDGTLHAYLDGGLSAMEAVRLESHLAECAPCRARLQEERAVLRRAGEILARAEPPAPTRAVPPLHDLRRSRVTSPRVPLAWAAVAVVALGAGWFARSAIFGSGAPAASEAPAPSLATEEPPPAPSGAGAARDEAERKTTTAPAPAAEVAPAPAPGVEAPAPDTSPRLLAAQPPAPAPSVQVSTLRDSAERRLRADSIAPAERVAVAREALAPPGRAVAQQNVAMAWPPITTDSARALLGSDIVVVPDLPLRGIRGSVLGDSVVLVEQGVGGDPGVMVRLYQRRASVAAGQVLGGERLARYVGALRVEILGPLPADSLSKLLEKARPIR